MSDYVAALGTVIAVFVMLRAERKDVTGELRRIDTRIDALETKWSARIDALEENVTARLDGLDSKLSARLDIVVLELGKAFGRRPAS